VIPYAFPYEGLFRDPWLPTTAATRLQLQGTLAMDPLPLVPLTGGYLRALHVVMRTSCDNPSWTRPRHAAARTVSRRRAAGSRRTRRYGPTPPGPVGRPTVWADWPFNIITSEVTKP
jgi:hypothetical protein